MIKGPGLNLHFDHLDDILCTCCDLWFEIIAEDLFTLDLGKSRLKELKDRHDLIIHSLSMNLAGVDRLDKSYLKKLKNVYKNFKPKIISDHLCFSSHKKVHHHDLLPVPFNKKSLANVVSRINYVQDFFNQRLAIENITYYIDYKTQEYTESEFINEVVKKTGCSILLDISNSIINHANRSLNFENFFASISLKDVDYIHLSGGSELSGVKIDSHSSKVAELDIQILKNILKRTKKEIPYMIERNQDVPEFSILFQEITNIQNKILSTN